MKIALLGDYSEAVSAHRAIPLAIELASAGLRSAVEVHWINSEAISVANMHEYAAIWCVPASPYANMENVLDAIHFARTRDVPFLGTCGGYQHAALEFARNALGYSEAKNAEVEPEAKMPVISALACKLVEVADQIQLQPDSRIAAIYRKNTVSEEYRCSFGVNPDYLHIFDRSEMKFTGFDAQHDPRVLEIPANRFFIGTAFQPERSAFHGQPHPIVRALLEAAAHKSAESTGMM